MENSPLNITEEYMAQIQLRVQDMFLQANEEQQWEKYCLKEGITQDGEYPGNVKVGENVSTYAEIGVQAQLSTQPAKKPTPKQKFSSRRIMNKPKVSNVPQHFVQAQNQMTSEPFVSDIELVANRFFQLQADIKELKRRKSLSSSYAESSDGQESRNRQNTNSDRTLLLRESLQRILSRIDATLPKVSYSNNYEELNVAEEKRKGVTFQIPYVIKEENAVQKRLQSWPNSSSKALSKRVPTRKPPVALYRMGSPRYQLKKGISFRNISSLESLRKGRNMEKVIDELTDELIMESAPAIEEAQRLKRQYVRDSISIITKKLSKIEESEREIRERWEAQKTALATSTYTLDRRKSIEAERKELESHLSEHKSTCADDEKANTSNRLMGVAGETHETAWATLRVIDVDASAIKNIVDYKRKFAQYLHHAFHLDVRNPVPWKSFNNVAEAILDDCFQEIELELQNIPKSIVLDLYNNEFVSIDH